MSFDVTQNSRLDSAIRKIEVGTWILRHLQFRTIIPVAMLDLRDLEFDGVRIAMRRDPVNDGASRVAESQQLGYFVERFSGSIVARVADRKSTRLHSSH